MFKKAPIAAALFGLALTTTPALAGEAHKVRVETKDLDLTTSDGQRTLEKRLDNAAREACGYDRKATGTRLPTAKNRACYRQAKAQAKTIMANAIEKASAEEHLGG